VRGRLQLASEGRVRLDSMVPPDTTATEKLH
jgi:hypothetical protein